MDKPTKYYINGTELVNAPKGWDTDYVKYLRSEKYYGMFHDAAVDLEFVRDGADLLRAVYYAEGSQGVATLTVERLNRITLAYETIVDNAMFDFTTFVDNFVTVKCQVKYSGIDADVKANADKKYTIPLPTAYISYDGVALKNANSEHTSNFDSDLFILNDPSGLPSNNYGRTAFGTLVSSEVDPFDRILTKTSSPSDADINTSTWFLQAKARMQITVNASFSTLSFRLIHPSGSNINEVATLRADLVVTSSGYAPKQTINIWQASYTMTGSGLAQVNFSNISNQVTAIIDEDDKVHVVLSMTLPNATEFLNKYVIWEASSLIIDASSQLPTQLIRCIQCNFLFQRLIELAAPTATALSNYLNSLSNSLVFTSGSAIRDDDVPTITISLNQFFDAINAINPIGMAIDGSNVIIEERQYFYDDSEDIDLGEVRDLEIKPAEKLLCSTIVAGCETQEYDQDNGRDEFNARQEWETTLNKSDAVYNIVTPVRTDMYGIDTLRVQFASSTKDNKDDNATFMIDVEQDSELNYICSRSKFTNIGGLTDDFSAFNLLFSPKRCIIRHGSELRSMLYFNQTSYINLLNHDKNVELTNTLDGVDHNEATSILVSDLAQPYFKPIVFSFEFGQNITIFATMKDNANKLFTFKFKGATLKWWLQDVSVMTANSGVIKCVLLCDSSTDLTQLS